MPKYPLPSDESDQRPGLKPPQFGLSSFLWLFAALAIALYALRAKGPLAASVVILAALAIAAHVLGNALGTQLRNQAKPDKRDESMTGDIRVAQSHHFAPTTKLGARQKQLSKPMIALSTCGSIAGSVLGTMALAKLNADKMTLANIVLAAVSCGVLGGLAGFLFFSFSKVAYDAWRQAQRDV